MNYITLGSLLVHPPQKGLIFVVILKNGNILEKIHKVWTALCTDIQDIQDKLRVYGAENYNQ